MNHPYIANMNGHDKHNKMLNDAEAFRKAKKFKGQRPTLYQTFSSLMGKFVRSEKEPSMGSSSKASTVA